MMLMMLLGVIDTMIRPRAFNAKLVHMVKVYGVEGGYSNGWKERLR